MRTLTSQHRTNKDITKAEVRAAAMVMAEKHNDCWEFYVDDAEKTLIAAAKAREENEEKAPEQLAKVSPRILVQEFGWRCPWCQTVYAPKIESCSCCRRKIE